MCPTWCFHWYVFAWCCRWGSLFGCLWDARWFGYRWGRALVCFCCRVVVVANRQVLVHHGPTLVCQLSAMDCFEETAPGEQPPSLGSELKYTNKKKRPHSNSERFKPGWTYTFSLYSRFVDFENWQVCQIPALGRLDINGFFDEMRLQFVMYMLDDGQEHLLQNRDKVLTWHVVFHGKGNTGAAAVSANGNAIAALSAAALSSNTDLAALEKPVPATPTRSPTRSTWC
eukprot:m.162617 g.162617  ORF g.162617 m.162617 type:complete len:228 (+) comp17669_c0_seq2:563-1246(+)